MTSPPTFTPWKGGEESWQIELQRWRVGWVNFGAEMSGAFRMFRNQQETRGFVNLSPCIWNGRAKKHTRSNWIFLKGLPSFPNGPTFQCLTCLICLWPMDRKGRNNTHLVDWDGTSRNSKQQSLLSLSLDCFNESFAKDLTSFQDIREDGTNDANSEIHPLMWVVTSDSALLLPPPLDPNYPKNLLPHGGIFYILHCRGCLEFLQVIGFHMAQEPVCQRFTLFTSPTKWRTWLDVHDFPIVSFHKQVVFFSYIYQLPFSGHSVFRVVFYSKGDRTGGNDGGIDVDLWGRGFSYTSTVRRFGGVKRFEPWVSEVVDSDTFYVHPGSLWKWSQFDLRIFFKWVGSTTTGFFFWCPDEFFHQCWASFFCGSLGDFNGIHFEGIKVDANKLGELEGFLPNKDSAEFLGW